MQLYYVFLSLFQTLHSVWCSAKNIFRWKYCKQNTSRIIISYNFDVLLFEPASNKVASVKKQKPKKEKEPLNAEHMKEFPQITDRVEYLTVKNMFTEKLAEFKTKNQELKMQKTKMLQKQADGSKGRDEQRYFVYHNDLKVLNTMKKDSSQLRDLLAVLKFRVNEFVARHER